MQLTLEGISKKVGPQSWLYDMSISPRSGAVTVLLGATQSGKTSLMRIMAGLDEPTEGKVLVDGQNVVGVPVRERNVAMVYQQFINYSSLRVYDNIASPMKLRGFGDGRFCSTVATLTAPAVSTSAASSSMLSSSALSALSTGEERPTSTTRSRGCSTVLSLFSSIGITFSAFLSFSIRKGTKNVKKKRSASADLFRSSYLSRPNFLLNLATRPPVSTSFCLPVK